MASVIVNHTIMILCYIQGGDGFRFVHDDFLSEGLDTGLGLL